MIQVTHSWATLYYPTFILYSFIPLFFFLNIYLKLILWLFKFLDACNWVEIGSSGSHQPAFIFSTFLSLSLFILLFSFLLDVEEAMWVYWWGAENAQDN